MTPCPQCQQLVTPGASDCAACGYSFGAAPEENTGPKGIGGWLLLPLLGLIISPIRIIHQIATELVPVLRSDVWSALTHPASANYHPLWAPAIIFEMAGNAVIVLFGFWVLASFLTKSSMTPRLLIIWVASFVAIQAIDILLMSQIPMAASQLGAGDFRELARAVISAAIWIPYFLKSKRVANTFVH